MAPSSVQSSIQSGLSNPPDVADDPEINDDSTIQRSLLGVLYTVNKEKSHSSIPWIAFRLLSDWLQLWLLMVNPLYGFNINAKETTWQIFSFIQLNAFMTARGYTFFLFTMYLFVGLLAGSLAISIWIGWSFSNNRFNSLWPIVVLRSFSNFFFQALDIASMTLFLQALDCQYWSAPPGQQFHNQEFRGVQCFTLPHLIHAGVAAVSLIVFIFMATLFTLGEMELNPVSRDAMAIPHSRVEVLGFLIKVLMTFASTFISSLRWLCIVQLTLALIQLYLYTKWVPMLLDWVNHVRCASYASITYAALIFVLIVYELGIDRNDPHAVKHHQVQLTWILYGGAAPAFVLGGLASWYRLRYYHNTVLARIRDAPPNAKPRSLFKFTDGRQVEVLLRSCRIWVDEDTLHDEAVSGAEAVLTCAMAQLPKDPYVIILYSSFLIEVQSSYQTGYAQLQAAKKADPDFLMRFAIFSREQQHTQRSASTGASGPVDLVGYVELQRNYQLALKVHRDALLATRAFWTCLLQWNVSLRTIARAIKRIDNTVVAAERVYKAVMRRHVNNAQMLRMYAAFLETVKHDPWGASKWLAEADKLEEQEEHARNDDVFKLGDKSLQAVLGPAGSQEARGVVVIDAQGIVQMVNQTTLEMFGYGKMEMKGKNINLLVPPPFTEHHTTYIRNYITTGTEIILNSTTQIIAMHKDRYVMPIALTVTKISGIGEDTMFLGVITNPSAAPDTATIWATASGQVISVDMTFTDWTGFKPEDVAGRGVTSLVHDTKALETLLAGVRKAVVVHAPNAKARRASAILSPMAVEANLYGSASPMDHMTTPACIQNGSIVLDGPCLQTDSALGTRTGASLVESVHGAQNMYMSPRGTTQSGKDSAAQDMVNHFTPQLAADLPKTAFYHKYCDPIEMDVQITAAGMGAFQLRVLTLCRKPAPVGTSHHVVVSDSRGRVIHATNSLATLLGTTSKQLQANNATHAVEKIMAAPFAQMHRTLAMSIPATAVPSYSCRSGLSILLAGSGPQGPYTLPFMINSMERRMAQEEAFHVMKLGERTIEQAVAERCLQLTCNMDGIVCSVGNSPEELFGFAPASLVGQHLTSFIDVFKNTLPDALATEQLLFELGRRAVRNPGTSINVALLTLASTVEHAADARFMATLTADSVTPAVLVVSMEGAPKSSTHQPVGTKSRMMLKLELWRSDLLNGVLQLDLEGKIMANLSPMPMYPAGPILGSAAESLVGTHISQYLQLPGKSHMDLLKPAAKSAEEMAYMRKRSSMRLERSGRVEEAPDTVVHSMRMQHMVDGQEMRLSVAAVKKVPTGAACAGDNSSIASMYLLMRITSSPPGGRTTGLLECLTAPMQSLKCDLSASMSKSKTAISPFSPMKAAFNEPNNIPLAHSLRNAPSYMSLAEQALPGTPVARSDSHQPEGLATPWQEGDSPLPDPRAPPRAQPMLEDEASAILGGAERDSVDKMHMAPQAPTLTPLATPSAMANAKAVRFGGGGASVAPSPAPLEVGKIDVEVPQDRIALWVATANPDHMRDVLDHSNMTVPENTKDDERDDMRMSDHSGSGGRDGGSDNGSGNGEEQPGMNADLSDVEEPPDEAEAPTTDYKKGSRSKRIMRLLSTDAVQASKGRFRLHTRLVLLTLAMVNIGGFVLMNQLLVAQSTNVDALNTAGLAARYANRISTNTRQLNIIFANQAVPGQTATATRVAIKPLVGLTGPKDIPNILEELTDFIKKFQAAHEKSYKYATSSRASPVLRSIWRNTNLTETGVFQIPVSEAVTVARNSTAPGTLTVSLGAAREDLVTIPSGIIINTVTAPRNQSLFTLGNLLVGKAFFVVHNAYTYNASLSGPKNTTNWGDMASAKWITTNAPNVLSNAYLKAMDLMLLDVIAAAYTVNKAQIALLVCEGVALTFLACIYVAYLTIKVSNIRRHIFTIFLSVPTSLVRGLASQAIDLPDHDEPSAAVAVDVNPSTSATGVNPTEQLSKVPTAAAGVGKGTSASQLTYGTVDDAGRPSFEVRKRIPRKFFGWLLALLSVVRRWRSRGKVHPKEKEKTRRAQLNNSLNVVVWMVSPLLLWGALVVLMNLLGHNHLSKISSPISIFNIINFVTVRYQQNYALMMEVASNPLPASQAPLAKAYGASTLKLVAEYNAMMYGGAFANASDPHFAKITNGISDQPLAGEMLYHLNGCACTTAAELAMCAAPSDLAYTDVSNGLEVAMQKLFDFALVLYYVPTLSAKLWGPEFAYYWSSRNNIRCALQKLNLLYQDNVIASYQSVLTLHIVMFIIAWIIFAAYLLFFLRPFVSETTAETRRVADLLSELPPEMDVEGLIQRMVIAKYVPPVVQEETNKVALQPAHLRAMSLREASAGLASRRFAAPAFANREG